MKYKVSEVDKLQLESNVNSVPSSFRIVEVKGDICFMISSSLIPQHVTELNLIAVLSLNISKTDAYIGLTTRVLPLCFM